MNLDQMAVLRQRVLRGEIVPREEIKEALLYLRQGRKSAEGTEKSAKSKKSKGIQVEIPSDQQGLLDMLCGGEGLL